MTAYIGTRSARKWTGLVGSGGVADASVTTVPVSSTTGLTNGKVYLFYVDRVDSNGVKTPNSEELIKGTLSGSNFINCTRGVAGTAQAHSAGAVIEVLWTSTHWEELIDALEVEHNSDGTHNLSGVLPVAGTSSNAAEVRLAEDTDNGTNYMGIKAPAAVTTSTTLVLPDGDGTADQVIKTDGSGNLSWTDMTSLTKAAGSDVTTGTDDAKYVTSKALADANVKSTGRLVWSVQTALSPAFTHSASTGEEEVTGLRTSLPVLTGTYTIIVTFIGYLSVGTANNVLKIRVGTSTSYLTNAEKTQIYIGNAKTQETATCKAIFTANLATQTYVVVGAAADAAASSFALSSSGNRTSVCIEVYSP